MGKNLKALTAGILAGTFLLGGMAMAPQSVEAAATISAKSGASVNIPNKQQIIENAIRTGLNLRGQAQYSHNYVPGTYMDCSQFTYYIFKQAGIDLHTRSDKEQAKYGTFVPKDQLKRGDLIFFSTSNRPNGIGHVGVYLGNGKLLDMANTTRDVAISDLNSSWYSSHYQMAKRVVN